MGPHPHDAVGVLATRLREAWPASGSTLREVAGRSGWAPAYLSRAFGGWQTLSLPALRSVAETLRVDYRQLLEEAGVDEETYRSRHTKAAKRSSLGQKPHANIRGILIETLGVVRAFKAAGKPEQARGALSAVEFVVRYHLGGFPVDRETRFIWAALLCERVGIVQDVQLPRTVRPAAAKDLDDILTIANHYGAEDLGAAGHFYAGDAHLKAEDFTQAITHYEQGATYAPTASLRVRSLAGWAICTRASPALGG